MDNQFCMVLTTVNCDSMKKALVEAVLENKLAACIQSMPIHSHYVWDGKICEDHEQLLIMKTKTDLYDKLETVLREIHKYDVPEIVQVPFINGLNPYLEWIEQTTAQP